MIHVTRFTASWCNPCKALAPVFKELEATMPDIKFSTIDIEAHPVVATQYKVRSIPTVIIEKDDAIVQTFVGLQSKQIYIRAIEGATHEG